MADFFKCPKDGKCMKMLMVITGDLHFRLGTHPNFIRRTANLEVNEPWFSRVFLSKFCPHVTGSRNIDCSEVEVFICNDKDMGMGQNLVPLVNPKIAGKWMFIPLKMVLIGIDPYPYYICLYD